jgi:hypothetical protein
MTEAAIEHGFNFEERDLTRTCFEAFCFEEQNFI